MTYDAPAHGSARLEDRAAPESTGIIRRYGPDPASRFYKLDQILLRDGKLKPLEKLILIDLFHRANKGERVTSIRLRAEGFGVSHDTLARAEQSLARDGYLLRAIQPGRIPLYLAAYPAIPADHPERPDFETGFTEAYQTTPDEVSAKCGQSEPPNYPQNGESNYPQNVEGVSRFCGDLHVSKKHEEGGRKKEAAPPASLSSRTPEPEELWPQRGPRLTDAQTACIRDLTEQIILTRSDCREGEGEMWLALFEDGLTVERAQEVILTAKARPGFMHPRTMVYFRSMLREAVASQARSPVASALAEVRRRREERNALNAAR